MIRVALAATLLLTGASVASAQSLDDAIHNFIHAPGFAAEDIQRLEDRLAQTWLDTTSVTLGGQVGPLEKAMMIADTEIDSTRTRTMLAYGELIAEDGTPVSLIEVRHYNLGPTIHDMVVEEFGPENTADLADFGLGDHKDWRFVFQPLMNNSAMLIDASSRTISDKQASKADCMGRLCLDLFTSFDDIVAWTPVEGNVPTWPELYATMSDETATPAHAIAQLAVFGFWANAESGQYQWTGGEHPEAVRDATPYRFIGIDRNLGQEASIDAVWQETAVNDDELAAIAFRRAEVAGQIYLMRASQPR